MATKDTQKKSRLAAVRESFRLGFSDLFTNKISTQILVGMGLTVAGAVFLVGMAPNTASMIYQGVNYQGLPLANYPEAYQIAFIKDAFSKVAMFNMMGFTSLYLGLNLMMYP